MTACVNPACGIEVISREEAQAARAAGTLGRRRPRGGGGYCTVCYMVRYRAGERVGPSRRIADLLEDVQFLMDQGERSLGRLADRLSMDRDSLGTALRRAARRGDQNAIDIRRVLTS